MENFKIDEEKEEFEFEGSDEEADKIEEASKALIVQDLDSKGKAIMESKLPEKEKRAYMVRLGLIKEEKEKGIPFKIYAKIRQVPRHLHEAMMVWPKAKSIKLASREQWDEIFKDF